jgi:hyperosmotically inducible periplasmic protein
MKKSIILSIALAIGAMAWTGCRTVGTEYERSTGQYIDDKTLVSKVGDALKADPVYKLDEVTVHAFRKTVQLSGFVSSQEQKDRAGEIASSVAGVQSVANNLTLKPGPLQQTEREPEEQAEREAPRVRANQGT